MECPYHIFSKKLSHGESKPSEIKPQKPGCWSLGGHTGLMHNALQITYAYNKLTIKITHGTIYYRINHKQPVSIIYQDPNKVNNEIYQNPNKANNENAIIVGNTLFSITYQNGFGTLQSTYMGDTSPVPFEKGKTHCIGENSLCNIVLKKDDDVKGTTMELSYLDKSYQVMDISESYSTSTGVWIPFKEGEFDGTQMHLRADDMILSISKGDGPIPIINSTQGDSNVSKEKLKKISFSICHNESHAQFYTMIYNLFEINPYNEEINTLVTSKHPLEVVKIVFITFKFNIEKTKEYLKSNDQI